MISMKMSAGGRVVIPVEIRRQLGIKDGDTVMWEIDGAEARLTTKAARIKRAQALVRRHVPANVSLSQELITERRREARRGAK